MTMHTLPADVPGYDFNVTANRITARCRLRFFAAPTGDVVVVATELADNPGMSITNAVEELAGTVCRDFGIERERLVWVEHYPERLAGSHGLIPESYDIVSFTWTGESLAAPVWRPLSAEELAFLTGLSLPSTPSDRH